MDDMTQTVAALREALTAAESARCQLEKTLQNTEERFQSLYHGALDVILIIEGESGRILSANHTAERLLGYSEAVLSGHHFSCLFPQAVSPTTSPIMDLLSVQSGVFTADVRRADGSICPMDLTATVIPWHQGVALIATFRDVTERRQAQVQLATTLTQLTRSRDDLLAILNQLRLGTVLIDQDDKVLFLSEAAQRLFGLQATTVIGKSWSSLYPFSAADLKQLTTMMQRPLSQRTKVLLHLHQLAGREVWIEVDVQDDPRDPRRNIFCLYDVSEVHDLRRLLDDRTRFYGLIGKSAVMQHIYQQIRAVAQVGTTVLIEGETGTGKELVARAIHLSSARSEHPFIAVNCASLTESLLESQLFGHKRGAFTGATYDHQGFFEAAQGGTLFLDEIGDMPLNIQTSLLRVLQEREIMRLGESRPRKIDVRVLAATHRKLHEEVEKGTFRRDLLYRIRVARLTLPTLRERCEDIPLLVGSFLAQCRATTGKAVHDVSHDAMRLLMAAAWPGNVRELYSAIESAVIHCHGSTIEVTNLPADIVEAAYATPVLETVALDDKQRFLNALRQARGNRTIAAQLLGISRSTLYRRLSSLGLAAEGSD